MLQQMAIYDQGCRLMVGAPYLVSEQMELSFSTGCRSERSLLGPKSV